jgi:hypothetical protein
MKRCPFCGSLAAVHVEHSLGDYGARNVWVECNGCRARTATFANEPRPCTRLRACDAPEARAEFAWNCRAPEVAQ